VQHGAHAGNREVQLEVAPRAPGERRHTVSGPDAVHPQRRREAPNPRTELRVGLDVQAVGDAGDDALLGMQPLRALEDPGEGQRLVLHEAVHRASLRTRGPDVRPGLYEAIAAYLASRAVPGAASVDSAAGRSSIW
jgi:hypothetical protein